MPVLMRAHLSRDLRTDSYLIQSLKTAEIPEESRIVSVFSDSDWIVRSSDSCRADGQPSEAFENYLIHSVGHMGLLYNQQSFEIVVESLLKGVPL